MGGPVAQIAMIKRELVEEEKWVSLPRINRALAVYQVLPGPEAHDLCVYFGMLARGRLGAVLAGLGFMLPGFVLMFALSRAYLTYGLRSPLVAAAFASVQAAVVALIVRAVHRIGKGARASRWLWGIAALSACAQFFGVHFAITLLFAGLAYAMVARRRSTWAAVVTVVSAAAAIVYVLQVHPASAVAETGPSAVRTPSQVEVLLAGLKAGLLTFGGAYTVIPFLRRDAVVNGSWMTDAQFGFTLVGHDFFERVTQDERVHRFLEGVTAGVVGLIATAAVVLFREGVRSLGALGIFAAALAVLYLWHAKWAVLVVVLSAAAIGLLVNVG